MLTTVNNDVTVFASATAKLTERTLPPPEFSQSYDVLVLGAGNSAMAAAITARRAGASVLMLESANKDLRGGNSRHVRNIRYTHKAATDYVTGAS